MADLNRSIDQVSVIERQVTPLMLKMIDALDQFVGGGRRFEKTYPPGRDRRFATAQAWGAVALRRRN